MADQQEDVGFGTAGKTLEVKLVSVTMVGGVDVGANTLCALAAAKKGSNDALSGTGERFCCHILGSLVGADTKA